MGLPYGEEIMIVGRTMWTQSTSVTDGQTDGRTELRSQRPCNAERRTVKIGPHIWKKAPTGKNNKLSKEKQRRLKSRVVAFAVRRVERRE